MRRGTSAAEEFGKFLYKLRTDKGLSMRQVGDALGVFASTVSQAEKGQRAVKENKLPLWAAALGVSKNFLKTEWLLIQKENPDGPIIRRRARSIPSKTLESKIKDLSGTERNRVHGYIDALIGQRNNND